MQIIEKMENERFEKICDAGVELVAKLIEVLQNAGLGQEDAPAVIAIAAAGIAKGSHISPSSVGEAISSVIGMWREENEDGSGLIFDPAHRRPDFEAAPRDLTVEN